MTFVLFIKNTVLKPAQICLSRISAELNEFKQYQKFNISNVIDHLVTSKLKPGLTVNQKSM